MGKKTKEKRTEKEHSGRQTVFILECTQPKGSVSAVVLRELYKRMHAKTHLSTHIIISILQKLLMLLLIKLMQQLIISIAFKDLRH